MILPQPPLQVLHGGGQRQNGADLRGGGDHEAALVRGAAVAAAAQTDHDAAQLAAVHVDGLLEHDPGGVDVELVLPVQVVLQYRREKVMGGGDRMQVAGEVQVDVPHGIDLRITAAGGAPFDAEDGPERGLAQSPHDLLVQLAQGLHQPDGGDGLSLPGLGGGYGGHQHQLAIAAAIVAAEDGQRHLGRVATEWYQVRLVDPDLGGDIADAAALRLLCDLDVRFHFRPSLWQSSPSIKIFITVARDVEHLAEKTLLRP